ncbi:X-Pro dipeptidyl-peptidase (S15 family) protein [Penicillium hispanicum]|uniref:X-Pro dipeptidyl-peptidase (S15 family) protein n=1 Tax=Penicillium hispanicum TaxID=1080232 RepID=UPI00253FC7FF|nr:X-Pro dipeptidyl-peptidase (S15 family) protein [Penicillium hispanicum]KAJ5574135.1 X-Pro dipeptidyl-peptidase (S15 family) protein [Penicillium hispanicum]
MSAITIQKGPIQLAGLLYKPPGSAAPKHPALIVVHPAGGVKEQTAGLYASKLSQHGFVTVCYDASHQGESGGEPRFLEDPSARVSDIYSVIDYLAKQDFVDADKIAVVGVCAGGDYATAATKSDHRIQALATISMINMGDSARFGWAGDEDPKKHVDTLKFVAQQIAAENNGADLAIAPYIPQLDDKTPFDLKEAHEYYLTPRAQHPRACNKMLIRSLPLVLSYDAFHLAELYLNQPTLLIAGEKAGSLWHTERLAKQIGAAATKVIVPNAAHMDFYDKEEYVNLAVKTVAEFMNEKL